MSLLSVTTQPTLKVLLTSATGTGRTTSALEPGAYERGYKRDTCVRLGKWKILKISFPSLCNKLLPQLASFGRIDGTECQPDKTREIKIISFY